MGYLGYLLDIKPSRINREMSNSCVDAGASKKPRRAGHAHSRCVIKNMDQKMKKIVTGILFVIAFAVKLFHLRLGLTSIFVFKNNEPLSSWIFIISGPVSTLPATITAIFNKKLAGFWLVSGGILSFAAILPDREYMLSALVAIAAPMILIGLAFIGIAAANKKEQATQNQKDTPDQTTVR